MNNDNETPAMESPATQGIVLDMGGSQDIVLVQSLYQQLSDALESGHAITFDVSQTERLDTAVAQLLLSFMQATRDRGQAVRWQEPSEAFLKAIGLLGLNEELGVAA